MKTGAALRLLPLIYLSVGKPLPEEALVLTAHPVVEVLAGLIELGSARDLALLDIREVGVKPGAMNPVRCLPIPRMEPTNLSIMCNLLVFKVCKSTVPVCHDWQITTVYIHDSPATTFLEDILSNMIYLLWQCTSGLAHFRRTVTQWRFGN